MLFFILFFFAASNFFRQIFISSVLLFLYTFHEIEFFFVQGTAHNTYYSNRSDEILYCFNRSDQLFQLQKDFYT